MSFKSKFEARLHNGLPGDILDRSLCNSDFLNLIDEVRLLDEVKDSREYRGKMLLLSSFVKANFTPENLPGLSEICTDTIDLHPDELVITNLIFEDGEDMPAVSLCAIFTLDLVRPMTQVDIQKWEKTQEDPLVWGLNFWWDIIIKDDEHEWNGYLDENEKLTFSLLEN